MKPHNKSVNPSGGRRVFCLRKSFGRRRVTLVVTTGRPFLWAHRIALSPLGQRSCHGEKDQIFATSFFEENRDKSQKEVHEVQYVKVPNLGHIWANDVQINDTIWEFFEKHPLPGK